MLILRPIFQNPTSHYLKSSSYFKKVVGLFFSKKVDGPKSKSTWPSPPLKLDPLQDFDLKFSHKTQQTPFELFSKRDKKMSRNFSVKKLLLNKKSTSISFKFLHTLENSILHYSKLIYSNRITFINNFSRQKL